MFDIIGTQILCMTNDEKNDVLRQIEENYPKIHWRSGHKPTECLSFDAPMSIICNKDFTLTHEGYIRESRHGRELIFAKTLLSKDFTLPSKEHLMEFLED